MREKEQVCHSSTRPTQLPAMNVMITSTMYSVHCTDITSTSHTVSVCTVHSVVSCLTTVSHHCVSPLTHRRLTWLCTKVLSPLLDFIPAEYTQTSRDSRPSYLQSSYEVGSFVLCSADVASLYTIK